MDTGREPSDTRLLAVVWGGRLEAAEAGLAEAESALRHLARIAPPESAAWVQRARQGLARTRAAIGALTGYAGGSDRSPLEAATRPGEQDRRALSVARAHGTERSR